MPPRPQWHEDDGRHWTVYVNRRQAQCLGYPQIAGWPLIAVGITPMGVADKVYTYSGAYLGGCVSVRIPRADDRARHAAWASRCRTLKRRARARRQRVRAKRGF
jgi:hypothetical protein